MIELKSSKWLWGDKKSIVLTYDMKDELCKVYFQQKVEHRLQIKTVFFNDVMNTCNFFIGQNITFPHS